MRLRWFLFGAVFLLAITLIAAAVVLRSARGFSARQQPTAIEAWLARSARAAAVPADARARTNPTPQTPRCSPMPWPIGPTIV